MFCRHCGKEIEDHSAFCEICGEKQEEEQEKDGGETSQNSSFYNENIKPEKKKKTKTKTKKPVGKGVIIIAIILVAAGVYFIPKYWKPGDNNPPAKDKTVAQDNSGKQSSDNKNNSTQSQYGLEEILQSDRWIIGPIDDYDYMAFEFYPDGTGYIETAFLLAGNMEIPGWSSEEWVQYDEEFLFDYEVRDDWVYITLHEDEEESEMAAYFTLKGADITKVYLDFYSDEGDVQLTLPVCADPDLQ